MYNRIIKSLEELKSEGRHEMYDLGFLHGFRRMVHFSWFENDITDEEFDKIKKLIDEIEHYIVVTN